MTGTYMKHLPALSYSEHGMDRCVVRGAPPTCGGNYHLTTYTVRPRSIISKILTFDMFMMLLIVTMIHPSSKIIDDFAMRVLLSTIIDKEPL